MSEEKVSLSTPAVAQPGEQGYVPPAAAVPLPSKGRVYPSGHPFHNRQVVEIKSMTAREEDILTSRALIKQGKAVDALLKSCILDKMVQTGELLSGDRNAIMIAIRITGYGNEYKTKVECPACSESVEHIFDLATLPIKPMGEDPTVEGENKFSFKLPTMNKTVSFKLTTGADETELLAIFEKMKKLGQGDSVVTMRLLTSIVAIDGETDRNKITSLIRNMPARDSRALRLHMDAVAPGVEMKQLFSCPSCGDETEVTIPLGVEFFWPAA